MSISRRALLAAGGATFAGRAVAQPAFPSRPLIIVVPYTAGSSSDVLARVLAPPLGEQLGQTVVVENRPGAGGTIGVGYVTRSAPDGHTMVLTSGSAGPINRALYRNLSFDPVLDLSLVGQTNSGVVMLVVSAASPIRSVGDLMTMATAPGAAPVRYFSPGNGTYHHLCAALLAQAAPDRMEHIPYRGPPEGVTALLAGEVTFGFASPPSVVGLIQEGRIRAIELAGSADPSPRFPDVPTLASSGFPVRGDAGLGGVGRAPRRAATCEAAAARRDPRDRRAPSSAGKVCPDRLRSRASPNAGGYRGLRRAADRGLGTNRPDLGGKDRLSQGRHGYG